MATRKTSTPDAIITVRLPLRCPACAAVTPDWLRESGGVTRLSCARCGWTERYLLVEKMPDAPRAIKGGEHLMFKKRHRVGPHR